MGEVGPQLLEADEVGVQTPAAYLVAARLSHRGLPVFAQERADGHHRTSQRRTLAHKLVAGQIVQVYVGCREGIVVLGVAHHVDTHVLQQLDEIAYIQYLGDIGYPYRLGGEQTGTDYLQSLVLGALRGYLSVQSMSALDDK